MRLGIRRKLIGTLILVGLLPLAMSLVVILGGGTVTQLSRIRSNYEAVANTSAERVADTLLRDEIKSLIISSREPALIDFVRHANREHVPSATRPTNEIPTSTPIDDELDTKWPSLNADDPLLASLLNNPVTKLLHRMHSLDEHPRQIFLTNAFGQTIAAESKTDDYFQADEDWWQIAFNKGQGRLYISSIINKPGRQIIELAIPVLDPDIPGQPVIGIIKDKVDAEWVLLPLKQIPIPNASTQLIDAKTGAGVFTFSSTPHLDRARKFYLQHQIERPHVLSLVFNDIIIGASHIPLEAREQELYPTLDVQAPDWVILVSKPSEEAMAPVYYVAKLVAGIGIALILVLFILGIAISNREIIMPILRLREATAAVGRGELNVRLLADESDPTFRKDELGDLARDFDEMTRQLQKNVNQLVRSNEAKRRFMELAGHELRTPVTYLIGVCQLAQRQIQQLAAAATDGQPEDARTIALAAKSAAATQQALAKIAAKTQRLSRIIDNLLKLVMNDQFTTRMNKTPVDVRALLLQVTSDHRPFIAERKQQLILDIAENLPSIEADKDKLEDALTNLISNAIRFSPDGSTIRLAAHEVVGDMLEILVEDSGPGIPPQDLANLFEPFYTGSDILHHHSGTFEFGSKGIGLGLAVVRRFIELHGGVVRAHLLKKDESRPPNTPTGTQFQILLPLNKEQDTPPQPEIPPTATPTESP